MFRSVSASRLLISLVLVFLAASIALSPGTAPAQDRRQNAPGEFDFYVLALSWSPSFCEQAGDRMAILDTPPNLLPQDVLEWRMNTAGYDSKMAALYYPWIEVMDPLTNQPMLVPPSGHVAGVWCRTDSQRGVHKAPANEVVLGANGLGFQVTQAEQGGLNKAGIN